MSTPFILISHAPCLYVQRIAIALTEKGLAFYCAVTGLSNKTRRFLDISPLGRRPVLKVGGAAFFESAAILEYFEETQPHPLLRLIPSSGPCIVPG